MSDSSELDSLDVEDLLEIAAGVLTELAVYLAFSVDDAERMVLAVAAGDLDVPELNR